jgi:multidrug resistance efflux pump
MVAGLLVLVIYVFLVWLVFFKLKLIKFSMTWGVVSFAFGVHILLIFFIGLRFVTPYTMDAKVIQHTIQLIPRLPEPTLVTAVLVKPNTPVKKGQPLFQFDRRLYQYKVDSAKAQLAAAKQNVLELKAQWDSAKYAVVQAEAARSGLKAALSTAAYTVAEARANQTTLKDALQVATATVAKAKDAVNLAKDKFVMAETLLKQEIGAVSQLNYDQRQQNFKEAQATLNVDLDTEAKARAAVETGVESVQVAVANQETARVAYEEQAPAAIQIA